MPPANFIPFNEVALQQMFLGQMAPPQQMAAAQSKNSAETQSSAHGQMAASASEESFPGFGFGTHPAPELGTVIDPGFQSAMASLNPMASMAEGLEFMKPSFESAAALHSSELTNSPFGGASSYGRNVNFQGSGSSPSQFGVSRSGLYPPVGQMAPVFTRDRPVAPPGRKSRRGGRKAPAETRTYHSEFEYSAPRRERTSYSRGSRPAAGSSSSADGHESIPPPPPSSYDGSESAGPSRGSSYDGSESRGSSYSSERSYGGPSHKRGRKPLKEGKVERYNSRETEFYDSDNYDGPDSSEESPNTSPKFRNGPSSGSSSGGPSTTYGGPSSSSYGSPSGGQAMSSVIPHPPSPSGGYRGPSRNKPKLKEGETYVEGYEWKGDPIPVRGGSAPSFNEDEARKRQEESSYSYTHMQKDKPKEGGRSKFSSGNQGIAPSIENGDDDEETRKQELRTTYNPDAGLRSSNSPSLAPSSSSYSSLSNSNNSPSAPSSFPSSSYSGSPSYQTPPSGAQRVEGPALRDFNAHQRASESHSNGRTQSESTNSNQDGADDKVEIEEDNSDVIPPGYEEVKF